MFKEETHYSTQLEKSLLGAILLEPTAFGRMYGVIKTDVFYVEDHKKIFSVLSEMWENNQPIDIVTATYHLHESGITDISGSSIAWYIVEITKIVCSTANLEYYSIILRQMYIQREMMRITLSGMGDNNPISFMDELQDKFLSLRQIKSTDDFKNVDEVLIKMIEHMEAAKNKEMSGITTGFRTLDKITGGLEPGGLYIVAARPSVGKSAFMGQMVLGAARKQHKVAVISLEMEDKKVMARIASIVTDVEFWRINRGRMIDQQHTDNFYQQLKGLHNLPIKISDTPTVSVGDIKSKVAKLKQRNEVDVVFIDYLGLIEGEQNAKGISREQEVSKMSRGIKLMAMQYQIPIVLLCQLNRMSEERKEKPKLHNLRESGSLEQDADGVMFIHRDWKSGKNTNENGGSTEHEADIIVAKWRNGETSDIKMGFDGEHMKFYELDEQGSNSNLTPVRKWHEPHEADHF